MCIYYKEKTELHYTQQEHVIPAGIGGIKKLPIGFVSDELNNAMSKLEQQFLRDSILSMPRQILGPGKRGSSSRSKATKSKIHLITNVHKENTFAIGYTELGKVYEIPHLKLNIDTSELEFSFTNFGLDGQLVIQQFKEQCAGADSLKIKTVTNETIPSNIILIGIRSGIEENHNCFIFKNGANDTELTYQKIGEIGESINLSSLNAKVAKYLPRIHQKANFKLDYFRIYGKIAFNFLADVKGRDFVMDPQFDSLRNWIAYGGDYSHVKMSPGDKDFLQHRNLPVPQDAHTIYVTQSLNQVIAQVFLYGGYSVIMLLSNDFTGKVNTDAFICDWKNRKEYRLIELLTLFNETHGG